MVRVAIKTCPKLYDLIDRSDPLLLSAFFRAKPFELMKWLQAYMSALADPPSNQSYMEMLSKETKPKLAPLETEAARISTMADRRGQYVLEELARSKLVADRFSQMFGQKDEFARSLWAYLHEGGIFEAAENSLHMRLYRRYDRHYQTFRAEPSAGPDPEVEEVLLSDLLLDLKNVLNRGEGYNINRFELPADGEEPASVMYLITHPNPASSVRNLDDDGNSTPVYFRPPGVAMIFYTPTTGTVHVRADTRRLRHQISDAFIEKILGQEPSRQPIDFQAYDISKFRTNFDLGRPAFDDVEIKGAKIIKIEVSVGDLTNRLAISTSIEGDLGKLVLEQPGLGRIVEAAIAVRFLEIAVRYRLRDKDEFRTLDFTITDRNTCSLLSVDDPFERVLGHRLLRYWSIMREGHAPSDADSMQALPALLHLWERGMETVVGAWLNERHIDPDMLIDIGFLVPTGQEGDDDLAVLEDEDGLGLIEAEVISRPSSIGLRVAPGVEMPGGSATRYRSYRVRLDWVAEHLNVTLAKLFGASKPLALNADLFLLGALPINGREVPIYLARSLTDENRRVEADTKLRERKDGGVGLVLQAGDALGLCLGENVLTGLADHLAGSLPDISLNIESLQEAYRQSHLMATGGEQVTFKKISTGIHTLCVPGKGSIDIIGAHRVEAIERLVKAHEEGRSPISSDEFRGEIKDQSLANIFGQPLWDKLKVGFVRSPRRPHWEIAV